MLEKKHRKKINKDVNRELTDEKEKMIKYLDDKIKELDKEKEIKSETECYLEITGASPQHCKKAIPYTISKTKYEVYDHSCMLFPDVGIILPNNEHMPIESIKYWKKACKFRNKDNQITMMFLRMCFEVLLKKFLKEPNSSKKMIGQLVKDLEKMKIISPIKIKALWEINGFLSKSHHSNEINFDTEVNSSDLNKTFMIINDMSKELFELPNIYISFKPQVDK